MGANRYAMNLIAGKTLEPIDKGKFDTPQRGKPRLALRAAVKCRIHFDCMKVFHVESKANLRNAFPRHRRRLPSLEE